MAILQNGPNGPIIGKFGSVNAYMLNGQNVVRGPKRKRTSPPTAKELLNRAKQKVAGEFAGQHKRIFEFGYQFVKEKGSRVGAFQSAQQHIFKEALELDADNIPFINPEKLRPFSGLLPPLSSCELRMHDDVIELHWVADPQYSDSVYKINLVLIAPHTESHLRTSIAAVSEGSCSVQFDWLKRKRVDLHVYVAIWDTLDGGFSNSTYCGVI
jgi:hypothetical protein